MVSSSLNSLSATSLGDQAYASIRKAILSGELAPGSKVTERGLAEMLGVSPTPIREALQRLVHDHQIERTGPRSLRVADFADESIAEIDEIEVELQVLAVRYAARKATATDVALLTGHLDAADAAVASLDTQLAEGAELDQKQIRRAFVAIRRFHDDIETIASNTVLQRALEQARSFTFAQRQQVVGDLTLELLEGIRSRYSDHRMLLRTIAAHEEDEAAAIMRRHTSSAHRDIRRVI
jgi:DNA-binding GntR family transcriptional regulator